MKFLRFLFAVIIFLPFSLLGQQLDGTNSAVNKNTNSNVVNNIVSPSPVRVSNSSTDEYGLTSNNTFLGNLGASGGYLAVPDAGGLYNLTSAGTVEAWIMPTATTSSAPAIVAKGDATQVSFLMGWVSSSSLLYFRIGSTPTTNTGGTTVPLNVWTHVAVSWSGTAGNYTLTFYVNGALSGSPAANTGTFSASTSDSLTIGITKPFTGNTFYGYIDEVKIWNVVRTQTQIAQSRFVGIGDYSGTNTGNAITFAANYTGLVSSWTFNNNYNDDVGGKLGYARNGAGLFWFPYTAGYPIPYNYALFCNFGANDFVTVPSNTAFNLSTNGTAEAWVYPTSQTTTHMIMSRGTTGFDFFWGIRASVGNKMVVNIGSGSQFVNTDGSAIPLNRWTHVAAKWTAGSGTFTVTFYVNGAQSGSPVTNTTTWTSTSGTLRIGGWHGGSANNFNGFIDEARLWSTARTEAQIRSGMFASCRSLLPDATLIGAWNFDGNLKNFAATTGIDGSFNTTAPNNCRLSAYVNESTTGSVPSLTFVAHPTVLNSTGYPLGFSRKTGPKSIPDPGTVTDTIIATGFVGNLSDIQVFLSIQHTWTSDLTIKLKAPNNTEVILASGQGGSGDNGYLTIMDDSIGNQITSTTYLSPWTQYVKPQNAMGTFGNTQLNGNWILTVTDVISSDSGRILGWGVRFNNSLLVGTENISLNLPLKYSLYQNYPNPFNPVTKIKFDLPENVNVKLKIYDILGKEVAVLVNSMLEAGTHVIEWDASARSTGIYFLRLEAGNFTDVKRMILVK